MEMAGKLLFISNGSKPIISGVGRQPQKQLPWIVE